MKKNILYICILFSAAVGLTSCAGEEDDIFDKSAAERLNDSRGIYTKLLTDAADGWAIQYYPMLDEEAKTVSQRGYLMLAKFKTDGTVDVATNYWPEWYTVDDEDKVRYRHLYNEHNNSLWEIITDNGPVLSFNSYNSVLHYYADPEEYANTEGYGGDYEFSITETEQNSAIGQYVLLKGKKTGTYNMLTPLPAGTDFQTYLEDVYNFQQEMFPASLPYTPMMKVRDEQFVIEDADSRFPLAYPEGTDKVVEGVRLPFIITKTNDSYRLFFKIMGHDANFHGDETMNENEGMVFDYHTDTDEFVDVYNSNNKIYSPQTAPSFFENYLKKGKSFSIYRTGKNSILSDGMRAAFDAASAAMGSVNSSWRVDSLSLTFDTLTNKATWSFRYTSGGRLMRYNYDLTISNGETGISFLESVDTYAENTINGKAKDKTANLKKLLTETLSQEFKIEAYKSKFNLKKIKLTAVNDPDLWMIICY